LRECQCAGGCPVLAAHGWNVDCSVCWCGPACSVLVIGVFVRVFWLGWGCGGRGTGAGVCWWAGERAVGCLRVRARAAGRFLGGWGFGCSVCVLVGLLCAGLRVRAGWTGSLAGLGGGRVVGGCVSWWCRLRCSSHPGGVWGWRVAGCCLRTAQWTRASVAKFFRAHGGCLGTRNR
jgi:hypothetical protein